MDSEGKLRLKGPFVSGGDALAWSPRGDEIWYSGIQATSLGGKSRAVWTAPSTDIQDIARDGRVLLVESTGRREIVGFSGPDATPRNLTALNWSFPTDISAASDTVLFYEQQVHPSAIYTRKLDGSPAVRIGDGEGYGISPDGRWALTTKLPERQPITLLPIGAGEPKTVDIGGLICQWANWFPDGRHILIQGTEPGRGSRLYVQDLSGGKPRAISPEGVTILAQAIAPDGRSIVARGPDGRIAVYPAEPGEPRPLPGVHQDEIAVRWTADGRSLYVSRRPPPFPESSTSWTSRPDTARRGGNSSPPIRAASNRRAPR